MFVGETISHYRIIRKLGGGGMGVVYEAEDLTLKRHVALKFLPEELAATHESLERFKREARSASALEHPNICTIHDIGDHKGRPYIVMEMLKGKTLKILIGQQPMKIDQVRELGVQIADALDAAHNEKIIHRDVKPANVFVTERGIAKLLDFGLAKHIKMSEEQRDMPTASAEEQLTKTGATAGTVSYMSPEQIRGKDVDSRSDIFSFGVMLYEMVTGKLPFDGQTSGEILEAIFLKQPAPAVQSNPNVPSDLERIIIKAMEKDPSLRYQSAAEIRSDLRGSKSNHSVPQEAESAVGASDHARDSRAKMIWITIPAIIIVLLISLLLFKSQRSKAPTFATKTKKTAIAVLPFANMSADKEQEYFSDGLTEELINGIARNPQMHVISQTSAFLFKGKEVNVQTIGEKLKVTHVLEGSVRKAGNRLRITAQLIEVATDSNLWSQTYDRQMENIFAIQEDIAASVAGALKVTLEAVPTSKTRKINPEAYNALLQGQYFFGRRTKEDLDKAIGYYEQALKIDSNYARPWVGLAQVHTYQADYNYLPLDEGYKKARDDVEKALQLDPNLAEAHARLSWIKRIYDWDWNGADVGYKRALELAPSDASVITGAAGLAATLGRLDEAIALLHRALEVDPLRIATHANLGYYAYRAGRLEEAEAAYRKALEFNPQFPNAHRGLVCIYLAKSKLDEAFAEANKESDADFRAQALALVYHAAGKKKQADAALAKFIETGQNNSAFQIAEIFAYRNETDKAFEWLERAYKQRDGGLSELKSNPLLRSLEHDPRWNEFLQKMKLPLN